ncbi:MAG: ABC transporter ATP-binding protein [Marinifilaceae bacterium]|jgi:ABC-2 type transport system ATP-binding protein|nr:ABC transporter ATP-binding protein [Marinifilaceae bacterium]
MESLKIENLSKKYGNEHALDNLSFELNKGEIVGLLGQNGAGKSTLMKIITGVISKDSGKVYIMGKDIDSDHKEAKKLIAYLPENNPLYKDMYIREYLDYVSSFYNIENKVQRIEDIIDITGLKPVSTKKISQLSKGYKQRVGIAQAIIHDPEILILDEPISGLDPIQLIEIRELLTEIGKNKTILISSHILQEIEAVCNRIVIINNGKLIEDKTIDQLHKQTIKVEFKNSFDKVNFNSLANIDSIVEQSDRSFILYANEDIREDIFNLAVKLNNPILEINKEVFKLEDHFKNIA